MTQNKNLLETEIKSVIVYQQGVQLTQIGKISLAPGEHALTITNLPYNLDEQSIRVKGIGDGKIVNINIIFDSTKEIRKEEYECLISEREKFEKQLKKHEKNLSRINEQIIKFKSTEDIFLNDWARAHAYGEVKINNFLEFDEKINQSMEDFRNSAENIQNTIKNLKKELSVISNRINNLGPIEEIHNFYKVLVNLNVTKQGEFILEVRYTMTEAWWVPFYDVNLTETDAIFSMMANVYNRTGLDWNDVDMEISSASLKPIALIKPEPMILKEYVPYVPPPPPAQPSVRAKARGMMKEKDVKYEEAEEDIDGLFYDMPAEAPMPAPEPEPELEQSFAEVSDTIGVQSFKISNKCTIPSDKNPHPVNLTIKELETEKRYYWSSSAQNVIIQDSLTNSDLLLLEGNVKIYFLEEFIGETSIPTIAPKEKFNLGTRVTYDLKIEKKMIDRSKDKKALRGKLKNNYEYKIIIKNLNDTEEDLTIYDRIPHSNSENINVEFEQISLEPTKKELGVLKWKLNMKNIKEKEIKYSYFIEYKKDIQISPSLP